MSQDEFTKLFKYMEERFDKVDDRFDKIDIRFDKVTNTLDGHTKRLTDLEQEVEVMNHQMSRFDKWFNILADNAKIKLKY